VFAEESPDWNLDLGGSADCELCGEEPATMHLLRVVDGTISHTHLCAHCAEGVAEQTEGLALVLAVPSVLRAFVKKAPDEQVEDQNDAAVGPPAGCDDMFCGVCGTTLTDLKESSMVGCANCYGVFREHLEATMRPEVERVEHLGKMPLRGPESDTLRHEMMRLERMLRELVAHERFEEAAGVRDRLAELGQRLDGGEA
jgi:protein arginine kinase activator